jgi:hypothetical protein
LQNSKRARTRKKSKLSYDDISDIVEYLVKVKSHTYTFDCYTEDDIGQEIRLICLRALDHFDMSRVNEEKLVNFFGRCVDNALKNLKRDNYIRVTPPCNGDCKLLHSESDDLQQVCKRWLNFKQNLQRKISVKHPINIETVGDNVRDFSVDDEVEVEDLKIYLMNRVDISLKSALSTMLYGNPDEVPLRERRLLQVFITELLQD